MTSVPEDFDAEVFRSLVSKGLSRRLENALKNPGFSVGSRPHALALLLRKLQLNPALRNLIPCWVLMCIDTPDIHMFSYMYTSQNQR